jgi:hypothetical protein
MHGPFPEQLSLGINRIKNILILTIVLKKKNCKWKKNLSQFSTLSCVHAATLETLSLASFVFSKVKFIVLSHLYVIKLLK